MCQHIAKSEVVGYVWGWTRTAAQHVVDNLNAGMKRANAGTVMQMMGNQLLEKCVHCREVVSVIIHDFGD